MNKKILIGIVAAVVVVAGAVAAYFYLQPSKEEVVKQAASTPYADAVRNSSSPQPNSTVRVASIANFYTDKSTRECVYTASNESGSNKTVFYFDKNRAFTVIKSTSEGQETTYYSLYKDGASYIWQEGVETGSKFTQTAEELRAKYEASYKAATEEGTAEAQAAAKNIVVTCSPWKVDESKFNIPTNVKFTELNA